MRDKLIRHLSIFCPSILRSGRRVGIRVHTCGGSRRAAWHGRSTDLEKSRLENVKEHVRIAESVCGRPLSLQSVCTNVFFSAGPLVDLERSPLAAFLRLLV